MRGRRRSKMAQEVGYTQFFSYIVRYQSKADASEHIIFYGAWDLKDIALSNLLPTECTRDGPMVMLVA